jgi:hypothetical protein
VSNAAGEQILSQPGQTPISPRRAWRRGPSSGRRTRSAGHRDRHVQYEDIVIAADSRDRAAARERSQDIEGRVEFGLPALG